MSISSNIVAGIPVFTREHYHIWAIKMRFYLRSQGLWNVVATDVDPSPSSANSTLAQIIAHEEEKLKKDKVITCLHSGLANHIFTKIMDLETPKLVWDKLQGEFEGSSRIKTVRILSLKKEIELMKMKDIECVKNYSDRLMDVVNRMRLLGKVIGDQKVIKKMMVSLPQKFEAKIYVIEESCDLNILSIAELTSKLLVQEQMYTKTREAKLEGYADTNLGQEQNSPSDIHCDNKFVNSIAENSVQHGRTKHINVNRVFYRSDTPMIEEDFENLKDNGEWNRCSPNHNTKSVMPQK
uniref:Uncharacterized protein n=1 Tax=Salix viminalis TaxID=40686 RepID=A0A6N2MNK0_SALVM